MHITISKGQISGTPEQFVLRAGYGHIRDTRRGVDSYVRRLSRGFYPRLHMYINALPDGQATLDLHFDQKEASYSGSHMHSGEYDGPIVEAEIARLRALLEAAPAASTLSSSGSDDVLSRIRPQGQEIGNLAPVAAPKRSWWQRLFS
jgi:hypothetical protein